MEYNEADLVDVLDHFRGQLSEIVLAHTRGLSVQFYFYLLTAFQCSTIGVRFPYRSMQKAQLLYAVTDKLPVSCTSRLELWSKLGFDTFPMPESIFDLFRSGRFAKLQSLGGYAISTW